MGKVVFGAGKPWQVPVNGLIVRGGKYNLICPPVNHRVNLGQPRLAQNKIIFA